MTDQATEDQVISELKEKLHLQEALWAQEKTIADKLSVQTKEQDAVHQCIWALEAKMDSLMAHHTIQSEQRELDARSSTQMMSALKSKYSTLLSYSTSPFLLTFRQVGCSALRWKSARLQDAFARES